MRTMLCGVVIGLMWGGLAHAQHQYPTTEVPTSEPAYLAKVKTAAPEAIVNKASIIMMQEGKAKELQAGSNGFTCLVSPDGTPLCADQNAMEWSKGAALLEHYVCVISPVEDESLSPDVAQVMYVSVRWPWRSGLHGAA